MKFPEYPIRKVEPHPSGDIEQAPDVPIIDVIRHGDTAYKHGQNAKRELLDTHSPDFELSSQHLDLTDEGIRTIEHTARDLVGMIDKDNEVILIVSSPSWRANSSALIVEKELRNQGINILTSEKEFKFSQALNESSSRDQGIFDRQYDENRNPRPRADREKFPDANKEKRHTSEALGFQKFLRHTNNLYKYLSPETLKELNGKRLRIICFTHAEITNSFIKESLDLKDSDLTKFGNAQDWGQILEIRPQSHLQGTGEVETDVELRPIKEKK